MVRTADPTERIGSVGELLQFGAEESAAVYAGAPLPAESGRTVPRHPSIIC